MQDQRATRIADLFYEAWMLASNLAELRRQLPDPNMPPTGKLPPDARRVAGDLRSEDGGVELLSQRKVAGSYSMT